MAAKKGKSKAKAKGSKDAQPDIPAEWVGKSVEELQGLVTELEGQLAEARRKRNKAQVEHGSIQAYYDVTREQIRELEMKIEKKDLEIENAQDDSAAELRVYEQKANFIKYCHANKLKSSQEDNDEKMAASVDSHGIRTTELEAAQIDMRNVMEGAEDEHSSELGNLQEDSKLDLAQLKAKLDADVHLFEQTCTEQHRRLQHELDSRRTSELKIIASRKESHMKDVLESHDLRCEDMRKYFEAVERQEEIDIEDLDAEKRRLKKAAIENESCSNNLRESNEQCAEELKICTERLLELQSKTKTREKDANSLKMTNTRLSAIRKAIREANAKYSELQEKFKSVEEDRDTYCSYQDSNIDEATADMEVVKHRLQKNLEKVEGNNLLIEQHLHHMVSSAGLDKENSDRLLSNLDEFIQGNSRELEKLNISIANATRSYNEAFRSCHSDLIKSGVSKLEADSIDAIPPVD